MSHRHPWLSCRHAGSSTLAVLSTEGGDGKRRCHTFKGNRQLFNKFIPRGRHNLRADRKRASAWLDTTAPARHANIKLLHTAQECRSFYFQTSGSSVRARDDTIGQFKHTQDLGPFRLMHYVV